MDRFEKRSPIHWVSLQTDKEYPAHAESRL